MNNKVFTSLVWTFTEKFGSFFLRLTTQMVLARILLPYDFGLIAMISIFTGIATSLVNGGMSQSLIRIKDISDKDYSAVFFMNVVIAVFLYCLLFFFSNNIANFYNEPRLELIVKIYMLSLIITSFALVHIADLNRNLNFKRQTIIELISVVISSIISVVLACMGFGVWCLVYGNLSYAFIRMIAFWIQSNWTPRLNFTSVHMLRHQKFGINLSINAVLSGLFNNIFQTVIGKYYSASTLGYYSQAKNLQQILLNTFTQTIQKVTYPFYAKLESNDDLVRAYKQTLKATIVVIALAMFFLSINGDHIVLTVLSDKWYASIAFFKLLCIAGILYPINAYSINIFLVKNRTDLNLKSSIAKKTIIVGILFVTIPLGIKAMIIGQIVQSITSFLINGYLVGRLTGFRIWNQIKIIGKYVLISLIIAIGIYFLKSNVEAYLQNSILILIILFVVHSAIHFTIISLFGFNIVEMIINMKKDLKPAK